jgi:hypothetical protein
MESGISMNRAKTTLMIDERLLRRLRVRAARSGKTLTEVVESALREGLGVVDRVRVSGADEDEALLLASEAVHEVRAARRRARKHA